ncbi:hypothetical protein [Streptomyces avermitilis]|uniref:hypothetical protein n=1 Tax=Streptomyces avermitilis TaxID=33903 RepID=UPI0036C7BD2B
MVWHDRLGTHVIDVINTHEHKDAELLLPAAEAALPGIVSLLDRVTSTRDRPMGSVITATGSNVIRSGRVREPSAA